MRKKWKHVTRDGTPVRIYAQDGGGPCSIHGAYRYDGRWVAGCWKACGRFNDHAVACDLDLIPADPERIVFEDVTFEDTPNASCAILRGVQYRQLQGKRGRLEFVVEDET